MEPLAGSSVPAGPAMAPAPHPTVRSGGARQGGAGSAEKQSGLPSPVAAGVWGRRRLSDPFPTAPAMTSSLPPSLPPPSWPGEPAPWAAAENPAFPNQAHIPVGGGVGGGIGPRALGTGHPWGCPTLPGPRPGCLQPHHFLPPLSASLSSRAA